MCDAGPAYRFGVFEVDPASGELRKRGLRVKLQGQPFKVLLLLLERAGHVVTREELHEHLWPSETFVDFDRNLNKAVRKLREALGDSADIPRFIETVPRRGYRFLGSIETPGSPVVEPIETTSWTRYFVAVVGIAVVGLVW